MNPTDATRRRYLELAWVLAVLLLVLGATTMFHGVGKVQSSGPDSYGLVGVPSLWFFLSVPLTALAPLLALRRPVVAVVAALGLPLGALIFDVSLFSAFAGMLATGIVLLRRSLWWGAPVAAAGLLLPLDVVLGGTMIVPDGSQIFAYSLSVGDSVTILALYVVGVVAALVAGLGYRSWAGNAEAQARLAADRSAVDHQEAVLGERSRLARDLHDVVAHHVSLIAVRAETAPYTVPDLQPQARVVLADVADHARQALDELRGVLGVLRRGEETDLAPQPTGADVVELVAKAQAVGTVELTGAELLADLDATRGYVAYRVVQEALTNARRHAPGEAVAVVASRADDRLLLRVTNRAPAPEVAVVPGRGLTGMRERVEVLGGTMSVEVRGGDHVVEVRLP